MTIFAFRIHRKMFFFYYIRDMIQLILSPVKGWEDISFDGYDSRDLLVKGFIPLIAVTSLSVFMKLIYVADASAVVLLQQAIICFLKYFASYFLANFVFTLYLPLYVDGDFSLKKCCTFIIYGLSLLAFVNLLQNCVPVDLAVLYIMPIYALYILWRGIRYLSVSFNGVGYFLIMTICAVIFPPYLLQYLFNIVVPSY